MQSLLVNTSWAVCLQMLISSEFSFVMHQSGITLGNMENMTFSLYSLAKCSKLTNIVEDLKFVAFVGCYLSVRMMSVDVCL